MTPQQLLALAKQPHPFSTQESTAYPLRRAVTLLLEEFAKICQRHKSDEAQQTAAEKLLLELSRALADAHSAVRRENQKRAEKAARERYERRTGKKYTIRCRGRQPQKAEA